MQIAICKALAKEQGREMEERFTGNIDRIVDYLLSRIWSQHDLGAWSKVALDGPIDTLVLTNVTESTLTISGLFATLGNNKLGVVPLRLELENTDDHLSYNFRVDRVDENGNRISPTSWKKVYLLAHGELREDWYWGREVAGSIG